MTLTSAPTQVLMNLIIGLLSSCYAEVPDLSHLIAEAAGAAGLARRQDPRRRRQPPA